MEIQGLSSDEVIQSRKENGSNSLTEIAGESFWSKLLDNFNDPMIKILCVALIINVVFTFLGQTEWYESVGIAAAVIIATFVSTYSEYKNEGAFQKLQEEASRIACKVYRDGELKEIPIDDIVVGDSVLLQSGDKVPADGFAFSGVLHVDQSVLNGETKEAEKTAPNKGYEPDSENPDFLNAHNLYRGAIVCISGGHSLFGQRSDARHISRRCDGLRQNRQRIARGGRTRISAEGQTWSSC